MYVSSKGSVVCNDKVNHLRSTHNLEALISELLCEIDSDPEREGVRDTPKRVARFYRDWISKEDPEFSVTTFEVEEYQEAVVVRDIPFFSLCEHHLIPFFGHASVGYIPSKCIVGLSKLPRVVKHFAARLQNQERLTNQLATFLDERLQPKGVAVLLSARHLCTEMRGVCSVGNRTVTSCYTGDFKTCRDRRNEFAQIISAPVS